MTAVDSLLALGFDCTPGTSSSVRVDRATVRHRASRAAMGTLVNVTLLGRSADQLAAAADAAFAVMDRLVALLGRRDPATPLAHLNRAAQLEAPPPDLRAVVDRALAWHDATAGAFDPTVLPLIALFEAHAEALVPALPADAEIREMRSLVGAEHVRSTERRLTLGRAGMALTLDGIAKGYVVDAMGRAVERAGVRRYLVEAGGDIRARGMRADGRPWRVAVQDPDGGAFPALLDLSRGAVATSGSYERRFTSDERHHHLLDPLTGWSPSECRSATVVAPTATDADALATSVFLMGPGAGCRFIERLPGCACLVIDRRGTAYRSRAWRSAAPATSAEEMS